MAANRARRRIAGWRLAFGLVAAGVLAGPNAAAASAPDCSRAAIATERAAGRSFENVVCYVDGVTEWQALRLSLAC